MSKPKIKKRNSFARSENPNSSKGTIYDPVASQRPVVETKLSQKEIDILFYDNKFCRRLLEDIARTAVKSGFRVKLSENTYDEDILKRWGELELDDYIVELLTMGQKDGISFLFPVIQGSGELTTGEELEPNKISKILDFNLFYSRDLTNMSRKLDKMKIGYGYIKNCSFNNMYGEVSNVMIDGSWLIEYEPFKRPDRFISNGVQYGDSYYKSIYDILLVKDNGIWSAGQMAYAMLLKYIKIGDQNKLDLVLREMTLDKFKAKKEMEINSSTLSILGKDDEIGSVNFGSGMNLKELKEYIYDEISIATGIPLSKLKGAAAGALASSTEDTKRWYEYIEGYQMDHLDEIIRKVLNLLYAEKGKLNTKFEIEFNSIRKVEAKEQAEIDKIEAEVLKITTDTLVALNNNMTDDSIKQALDTLKNTLLNKIKGEQS
ncbi:MAG: anti-CBASS protein Acb1 family protein [Paraclostridium sp.]